MELPINATGIIWNEHAKKMPLAPEALQAVQQEASAAGSSWESPGEETGYGLPSERQLIRLTEAEDALVLNNIYSAIFFVLLRLGKGKAVLTFGEKAVLPRGAGAYLDKLARRSGASLRWLDDPAGQEALRADVNNVATLVLDTEAGATPAHRPERVRSIGSPLAYARKKGLPAVKLLYNATLQDLSPYGLQPELQVQHWVQQGYDLVVFSGDSLLGGPPAGLVVGAASHISPLRRELLAPAFAPGRIIAAALEATLNLYLHPEKARERIPLLRAITVPLTQVETRARHLAAAIESEARGQLQARPVKGQTRVRQENPGLGQLPTYLVELQSESFAGGQLQEMMRSHGQPPVLARLQQNRLLLDLRSMPEEDDQKVIQSLQRMWKSKKSATQALNRTSALIWVLDERGAFLFANRASQRFWGKDTRELTGKTMAEVLPGQAETLEEELGKVLESGAERAVELTVETTEGEPRWFDVVLTPTGNGGRNVEEVTFTAHEITARKKLEEDLKYISMHDSLTGLYNRAYFEEEMRRLDTQRHYPVSIVVFDVDGLKLINDILGHKQGDEHIKAAAGIIRKPFRNSDVVARVGGDEFAVILPSTTEKTTEQICRRLKAALQEYNREQPGVPLSLSVGYATGEEPGEMMEIFEQADRNMYEDKFKHAEAVRQEVYQALTAIMAKKDFMDEKTLQKLERLVLLLGRSLGISEEEMNLVLLLARVYDIGKVAVDDRIIYKQGTLTPAEWEEVRRHPETGYRIASSSPEMKPVAEYILQHHEYWDGSGYPRGLKGSDIHLYARMLAIADAYSAMTSPRPYRESLSHEEALGELTRLKGVQFDPRLVDIFVSLVDMEINALKELN